MEQDAILNELALEIQLLREQVAGINIPESIPSTGEEWVFFEEIIPLVYSSPSAVTDWADTGSAEFIPPTAKRAIIMAWVEDTDSGAGRTIVEARGGGVIRTIASLYETVDTAVDSAGGGDIHVPISGGRFDWRLQTLAAGAAGTNVRIELVGYVK